MQKNKTIIIIVLIAAASSISVVYAVGGTNIIFKTSDGITSHEVMRITSDQKVGIGTTTPSTMLDVNGTISAKSIIVNGNSIVPATKFTPLALQDDKGNLWTSWFIKESLYYPTLYSTSCDAPSVDCYVNFSNISTSNGTGIEADTIGSNVYGYWFLGYSQEYVVPKNGTVTISGNFLKNNMLPQILDGVDRNHVFIFILDRDPNIILAQNETLFPYDNNTTWYHRSITFNLTPSQVFRVGIGAENNWATDYHMYVAWNGVTIHAAHAWSPAQ